MYCSKQSFSLFQLNFFIDENLNDDTKYCVAENKDAIDNFKKKHDVNLKISKKILVAWHDHVIQKGIRIESQTFIFQ